jgi:hypothetical protein
MALNVYPYIEPMAPSTPVYMHLSDINDWSSFFVFMDAAIKCHPFVLMTSFALSLLFIYIIVNNKILYHHIQYYYSSYLYNKGGE